jgi:EAL domain-containing protein (putative c-di-GMP-specific phosphodiesterase class I)
VEITESALLSNLDTARSAIVSLKNQGVRLSLDDFGTGYSSLHHLRALPFDRIKIDRSFVSSLLDSSDSVAIVTAVLGLGRNLGIEVTAEGIETVEIEHRLRELNCPMGQGWLYSKPVSSEDALRLLLLSQSGDGAGYMGQRRTVGAVQ